MSIITKDSPAHEKLLALIEVQTAIRSLQLVEARGLGTGNITKTLGDLLVYENQLTAYLTGKTI